MPYKRNVNANYSVEWTPTGGGGGGLEIGSKWPLPCFSLQPGGGTNYQMIDDYPSTDDATYNSTSSTSQKDIFQFQGFNFGGNESFMDYWVVEDEPPLALKLRGRYDNAGDAIQAFIVVDGTEYPADNPAPNGTFNGAFTEYTFYWELNPSTLDYWTYEQLNGTAVSDNLQYVGYDSSTGEGERKVSRMYVVSYAWRQAKLVPISDSSVQWTKSGNSYNYENLYYLYDHSYYNYSLTTDHVDKFGQDLLDEDDLPYTVPQNSDIQYLFPMFEARRDGESPNNKMDIGIWVNGTGYWDSMSWAVSLTGDWQTYGTENGWSENPGNSSPFTADDINGVGTYAITHISYRQEGTEEEQIDYFNITVNHFPNNEPA